MGVGPFASWFGSLGRWNLLLVDQGMTAVRLQTPCMSRDGSRRGRRRSFPAPASLVGVTLTSSVEAVCGHGDVSETADGGTTKRRPRLDTEHRVQVRALQQGPDG